MAVQVAPQAMPAGAELTVPLPVPALVTVTGKLSTVNMAVTLRAVLMVTLQVPVPVQAPPQLAKREPVAASGVKLTELPTAMDWLQVLPQSMPDGDELTLPAPVPLRATVSV